MLEIQKRELIRIEQFLKAAGAKYKIILASGEELGDLVVQTEKKRKTRGPLKYPKGTILAYILPYMQTLAAGTAIEIPGGPYDAEDVRRGVCSWMSKEYGKGSGATTVNRYSNSVEVLRHW